MLVTVVWSVLVVDDFEVMVEFERGGTGINDGFELVGGGLVVVEFAGL